MSPDLRKRFEQVGETALYVALGSDHHSEPFKDFPDLRNDQIRAAALQWLAESRELAAQRQRRRDLYLKWTLWAAIGAVIVGVISILTTAVIN